MTFHSAFCVLICIKILNASWVFLSYKYTYIQNHDSLLYFDINRELPNKWSNLYSLDYTDSSDDELVGPSISLAAPADAQYDAAEEFAARNRSLEAERERVEVSHCYPRLNAFINK